MIPEGVVDSEWDRIAERIEDMGLTFDTWQSGIGEVILGLRPDNRYAASVGGVTLSIPRQVGKTFTVGSLIVAMCVEYPGLLVLWTAHHGRTITKTFGSLEGMVRRKRIAPHLAAASNQGIRTSHGEQEIGFLNGSKIMFGAREHGFGRGFDAVDFEIFDEAQILSDKALEDMVPASNQARHVHGALLIYMGTPPRPEDPGEAFTNRRTKALAGATRNAVYVECSADEDADPEDRVQWAKANPSFPHHTPVDSMLRMRENLPSDASWKLEAFGIWPRSAAESVIPAATWSALHAPDPPDDEQPAALAVDMSHDRALSIAGCWRTDAGHHVKVMALDYVDDTSGAEKWIAENSIRGRQKIPVVIDSYSPAASMIAGLKARKVRVITTNAGDVGKACGGFYDDATATPPRLSHAGQEQLDEALAGAKSRNIGGAGGWGWDRKSPDRNIAPLVSVTLARFGAVVTQPKKSTGPKRVVVLS